MPMTDEQHTRELSDGNAIPLLGLGVWQAEPGPTWAWPGMERACEQRGVTREAYSPLTAGARLDDPRLAALDALDETGGTSRALERKWW
jgi:diketogulonate reductase-like aldo/keto reductase